MEKITAIIRDGGDESVGIFPQTWEVVCPFNERDTEILEFFRNGLLALYREFCDGNCSVVYDFEQMAEDEFESTLF
jgi:hypothetical protein